MNFDDVIAEFAIPGGITITRDRTGKWVNGRYVEAKPTTITGVQASVQPLKGYELEQLPEGESTKRSIKIYTDTELKPANNDTKTAADKITYDGDIFEIFTCEKHYVSDYWKAIAIRIGD